MLANLLKVLGGGLIVTEAQDLLFEDEPNPYNLTATVIGAGFQKLISDSTSSGTG